MRRYKMQMGKIQLMVSFEGHRGPSPTMNRHINHYRTVSPTGLHNPPLLHFQFMEYLVQI